MPEPGSNAYDQERKRLRRKFEDQGWSDGDANGRANAVLQGRLPENQSDVKHSRDAGAGHGERPRGSS